MYHPLPGGLAEVFGRKPVMMGALSFFLAGSVVCAVAQNMTTLIAGRGSSSNIAEESD